MMMKDDVTENYNEEYSAELEGMVWWTILVNRWSTCLLNFVLCLDNSREYIFSDNSCLSTMSNWEYNWGGGKERANCGGGATTELITSRHLSPYKECFILLQWESSSDLIVYCDYVLSIHMI